MIGDISFSSSQVNLPAILVANGLGACLIAAIMLNKRKRIRFSFLDGRLFYWMCRLCLAQCVLESLGFLLNGKQFAEARSISLLISVVTFMFGVILALLWVFYMDYKLFEDFDRLRRWGPVMAIPAVVLCGMALANLFVDIFFGVTPDNVYYRTPLFILSYVVVFFYLSWGAILSYRHRKLPEKYLYVPALIFLLPIYVGSLIQLYCYGLALIWPSTAVGLTFLYINLQSQEAFIDPLTNLYNRNYLIHYMGQLRKDVTVTGILLDINEFKEINDTCGHLEGDHVLQAVGRILLRCTNDHTAVIRYGGDEFVILLKNSLPDESESVLASLRAELALYNKSSSLPVDLSIASGIAVFETGSLQAFFREMDKNMYQDKRKFYLTREKDQSLAAEDT